MEQVTNALQKWTEKIRKLEVDIRNKDDNKEVALGTSKINYMDPRISVAWCKRVSGKGQGEDGDPGARAQRPSLETKAQEPRVQVREG